MQVIREIPIPEITIPQERLTADLSQEDFESLKESIRRDGLICPILLTFEGSNFVLVSGLHRLRAAQAIGWSTIPAVTTPADPTRAAILNITENIARGKTNPIDEAWAIQNLIHKHAKTLTDVSRLLNRPENWVASRLALLELPLALQDLIQNGQLSVAAAKELAVLEDPHMLEYITNQALEAGASAKTIHHWIGELKSANQGLFSNTPSSGPQIPLSATPIPMINCFACAAPREPHELAPELLCVTCRTMLHPTSDTPPKESPTGEPG